MFKVALQYLFNVYIPFNTVFNLKLLKIDQKMRIFKNLRKFWKPGKNFEKMSGNPVRYLTFNEHVETFY